MIELHNVSAGYHGRAVLQGVDLAFAPGQVLALIGPNGSGKSTLLRAALGLVPCLGGEVLYDGVPLRRLSARQVAQKAAFLSQSRAVPNLSAQRMVLHGRFPHLSYPRHYREEDRRIVRQALAAVDAADLAARPVTELSGGQRQKVYLAMAIAQQTPSILMDEPTTFLDIAHQLGVMSCPAAWRARARRSCWCCTTCRWRCPARTGWPCWQTGGWYGAARRKKSTRAACWSRCSASGRAA